MSGAGRGVGRATALGLAAEGMHLAVLSRTGREVRDLAEEINGTCGVPVLPVGTDVGDPGAVERLVAHVEQHLGTVDLLVVATWVEADPAAVPEVRDPLLLCRALLPPMEQRGRGHVVHVLESPAGTRAADGESRRAPSAFTESLARPLLGSGVVVVDVLPGSASATVRVIRDVAAGRYDDLSGAVLDVPALDHGLGPR